MQPRVNYYPHYLKNNIQILKIYIFCYIKQKDFSNLKRIQIEKKLKGKKNFNL